MRANLIEATIFTENGEVETVFIPGIRLIPTDLLFNLLYRSTRLKSNLLSLAC